MTYAVQPPPRENSSSGGVLEQLVVSRKTPLDGKLEVSAATAAQLAALGAEFTVHVMGETGVGARTSMECSCAKAAGERHVHFFVVSELFRKLIAGSAVRVQLDRATHAFKVEPAS